MTAADKRRLRKINRYIWPILERLGVAQTYKLHLEFVRAKDFEADAATNTGREIAAQVIGSFPYRIIDIHVNRQWIDGADGREIERVFVHEILHPILYDWAKHDKAAIGTASGIQMEENTVDLVSIWLLRGHGVFQ